MTQEDGMFRSGWIKTHDGWVLLPGMEIGFFTRFSRFPWIEVGASNVFDVRPRSDKVELRRVRPFSLNMRIWVSL